MCAESRNTIGVVAKIEKLVTKLLAGAHSGTIKVCITVKFERSIVGGGSSCGWIQMDLMYNEMASGYAYVPRPDAPKKTSNGSGDEMLTDGEMLVLQPGAPKTPNRPTLEPVAAK